MPKATTKQTAAPSFTAKYDIDMVTKEFERKIEAGERPFHTDLIHIRDIAEDLARLDLYLDPIPLSLAIKRLGHLRTRKFLINGKLSSLWVIRNRADYAGIHTSRLLAVYDAARSQPAPKLGRPFDPSEPL